MQYIIVAGNAIDGLSFYGPYDKEETAINEAMETLDCDWHVTRLETAETLARNWGE